MAQMEIYQEAQIDAELLSLDDKTVNIGYMPEDFICSTFLKRPGEYCISLTEAGHTRVSVKAEDGYVHHLMVRKTEKGLKIKGMLHGAGESVGELLYNLRDPTFDLLTTVLGTRISFNRLVQLRDLKDRRVFQKRNIRNAVLVYRDNHMMHYDAEAYLNGVWESCKLVKACDLLASEWRQKMFDEMRVASVAEDHNLPIKTAVAMVVDDGGFLVYRNQEGITLESFIKEKLNGLNIMARIRLMMDVVAVMADLHLAGIYHGALEPCHFFVEDVTPRRVLFNGAEGLAQMRIGKTVTLANFANLAPEVAWTRRLTPATGVYSLGRILKVLADVNSDTLVNDPNAQILQMVMSLTSICLSRRATARPTMDGVFLRLKEALMACHGDENN